MNQHSLHVAALCFQILCIDFVKNCYTRVKKTLPDIEALK